MRGRSRTTWSEAERGGGAGVRAFTVMEVVVSLGVIFLLVGLLLTTFRFVNRSATEVQARTTLGTIRMAISQFESDFGFPPPLVRDGYESRAGGPDRPWPEYTTGTVSMVETDPSGGTVRNIKVWNPEYVSVAGELDHLRFLRARAPYALPATADNPFRDYRFSNRTIAYYLVGALDVAHDTAGAGRDFPIDGVKGSGFYRPEADGTFEIPPSVFRGSTRGYKGRRFTSFLDPGKGGLQLVTDAASVRTNNVAEGVEVQDNRFGKVMRLARQSPEPSGPTEVGGRAIRYYRWEPGRIPQANGTDGFSNPTIDLSNATNKYADLNIPRLIGEDPTAPYTAGIVIPKVRDIEQNAALRSARWAIVHAGKDGYFGDEDILTLRANAGFSAGIDDVQLRRKVMEDNIVEVGP